MPSFEDEALNDGAGTGASNKRAGTAKKADYEVGYKRPPVQTRFKPGQSGNPRGRPKGTPNHWTTVNKVMNEKVSVREGEKVRRVNKFEAMLQAQANKGMKGDARSAGMVINVMAKTGLLGDQGEPIKAKEPAAHSNVAHPMSTPKVKPGDILLEGLDVDLLTNPEQGELAKLAEFFDENGIGGLSISQFERIKEIITKGKGANRAAA
jgi:Family of unknown function (DUF5681)